jgi:type I restriction enzyme, S subunit
LFSFLEISGKNAARIPIELPPTNEQHRIVAKLEKVEDCKERLEKIPTIHKRFRQSVLGAAFSSNLTINWRK